MIIIYMIIIYPIYNYNVICFLFPKIKKSDVLSRGQKQLNALSFYMQCYLLTLLQRPTRTPTAPTWSCTAFFVQLQVIPRKATTFPGYWAESKAELATSTIIRWWTAYKKQLGNDAMWWCYIIQKYNNFLSEYWGEPSICWCLKTLLQSFTLLQSSCFSEIRS